MILNLLKYVLSCCVNKSGMRRHYCDYVMYAERQVINTTMKNISKCWWKTPKMSIKKDNTWMIYKNLKNKMNDKGQIT